ncbi:hypothetical protein ID866_6357 [Astraeus odoratus]|nr:hypothetical protein ID866_6357 [Astraeus odoratus]
MTVPLKVNIGQLAHDDIIIVTVGPTGSAKSSFINIASGSHCDTVGHSLVSRTCEVSAVKYTDDESGQRIVLVDTPGLNNTSKGDLEVQAMISQWLRSMWENQGIDHQCHPLFS